MNLHNKRIYENNFSPGIVDDGLPRIRPARPKCQLQNHRSDGLPQPGAGDTASESAIKCRQDQPGHWRPYFNARSPKHPGCRERELYHPRYESPAELFIRVEYAQGTEEPERFRRTLTETSATRAKPKRNSKQRRANARE